MGRKDDYRRQAEQQSSDADELESGRWRWGNVGGSDEFEQSSEAKTRVGR